MRKFIRDKFGTVRFAANPLVQAIVDEAEGPPSSSINRLVSMHRQGVLGSTQADWEEFYQLIGYSLAGYHELSLVSDVSALAATRAAQEQGFDVKGCRDDGCAIHCGVPHPQGDGKDDAPPDASVRKEKKR
jgi:hypothetical protein